MLYYYLSKFSDDRMCCPSFEWRVGSLEFLPLSIEMIMLTLDIHVKPSLLVSSAQMSDVGSWFFHFVHCAIIFFFFFGFYWMHKKKTMFVSSCSSTFFSQQWNTTTRSMDLMTKIMTTKKKENLIVRVYVSYW